MLNSSSVGLRISTDPVQEMTVKYPRVLVIKAAFCLLKDGKSIEHRDLEKRYRPCYRDKHRRSLGAHFSPSCLR